MRSIQGVGITKAKGFSFNLCGGDGGSRTPVRRRVCRAFTPHSPCFFSGVPTHGQDQDTQAGLLCRSPVDLRHRGTKPQTSRPDGLKGHHPSERPALCGENVCSGNLFAPFTRRGPPAPPISRGGTSARPCTASPPSNPLPSPHSLLYILIHKSATSEFLNFYLPSNLSFFSNLPFLPLLKVFPKLFDKFSSPFLSSFLVFLNNK